MAQLQKELVVDLGEFGDGIRIRFGLLEIKTLKIDSKYQRDETDLVQHIADNFNPIAFVCALVAERPDGTRYLVDAQQRTKGAKLAGKTHVPCIIFESEGMIEEAKLFRYLNQFRRPVKPIDIFRASLAEDLPEAVSLQKAVEKAGLKIALKSTIKKWPYIGAIEQLQLIHRAAGPEIIIWVLELIVKLWPGQYEALRREHIRGMYEFVKCFGHTINEERLQEKMNGQPAAIIYNAAKTAQAQSKNKGINMHMYMAIFGHLRKLYGKTSPDTIDAWPPEKTVAT